jgi:hypothetical protein
MVSLGRGRSAKHRARSPVSSSPCASQMPTSARPPFRSPDHRVVCHLGRVGTLPPVASCDSRATLTTERHPASRFGRKTDPPFPFEVGPGCGRGGCVRPGFGPSSVGVDRGREEGRAWALDPGSVQWGDDPEHLCPRDLRARGRARPERRGTDRAGPPQAGGRIRPRSHSWTRGGPARRRLAPGYGPPSAPAVPREATGSSISRGVSSGGARCKDWLSAAALPWRASRLSRSLRLPRSPGHMRARSVPRSAPCWWQDGSPRRPLYGRGQSRQSPRSR